MTSEGNSTLLPANVDRRPPLPAQQGLMNLLSFLQETKVYDLSGHERIRQRSDDSKALKYYAQCPGVMQGSQEKKRATLWDPCDHFGANIPMKIV